MAGFAKRARAVRLAVFDVDGVLTDGTIYMGASGEALKAFNILDGHGLKMLQQAGIATAIITGRKSVMVAKRAKELAIGDVIQGATDKVASLAKLLKRHRLQASECAYMGDDLPDLVVMRRCGLAVAVANAVAAVKAEAHYVTTAHGGRGAVREFCEDLLWAQGRRDIVEGRA